MANDHVIPELSGGLEFPDSTTLRLSGWIFPNSRRAELILSLRAYLMIIHYSPIPDVLQHLPYL